MDSDSARPEPLPWRPVLVVVAVYAAVMTALSGRYGFHRDELYFVAAGKHLAWGYVDQPPLTPLLARISTGLFGETVYGLRVVATLSGVVIVLLTVLIARELLGGRKAQVLTAVAAAVASFVLSSGHMVSTETFDMVAWLAVSLLVLRLLRTRDPRWWLAIGAAFGIALLNKDLIVMLGGALLVGVLAFGPRGVLRSWWLLLGVAVMAALVAPNLVWEATHGWPELTVASGIDRKGGVSNRIGFIPLQFVYTAPPLVPIWLAGFVRMWRKPELRWSRCFVLAYPLLAVLMLAIGGKAYYPIPLLLVAMAAGAEPTVRWARTAVRRRWLVAGLVLCAVVDSAATLPVLPASAINLVIPVNKEQGEQIGWPELVDTVSGVWHQIPAPERDRSVVLTQNYGEAGAIAMFGPADGIPQVYSGHMSYADWGPPPDSANGPVVIVQFATNRQIEPQFTGCSVRARITNSAGVHNMEWGAQVVLCTGAHRPWSAIWPALRSYY